MKTYNSIHLKIILLVFFVLSFFSIPINRNNLMAQSTDKPYTVEEIVSLLKNNMKEQEIIKQIEKDKIKFDTSFANGAVLGRAGASDKLINVILKNILHPVTPDQNKLIKIIKRQQLDNVRESYGQWAGQCFTDDDLDRFKQEKIPLKIADQLKHNNEFLEVVLVINRMQPNERQNLLDTCLIISRPTWGEIGKISKEGQTEAGQKAEKMIASAIVDLVKELYILPDDEIRRLFR